MAAFLRPAQRPTAVEFTFTSAQIAVMQVPLEVTLDFWSVANYTMLNIHVEIIRHIGHRMMCWKEISYRFIGSWLNVNPCQSHPKSISPKNKEHLRFEVWKFQHHWPYCFVQIWFAKNPSISRSSFINEHTDQTLDTSFQVIIGIAVTMPLIHGSLWCISMMASRNGVSIIIPGSQAELETLKSLWKVNSVWESW